MMGEALIIFVGIAYLGSCVTLAGKWIKQGLEYHADTLRYRK